MKGFLSVHIRWMIRRDMPEVLDLERASFGRWSWTDEEFIRLLRQRTIIGQVAEVDEAIAGFIVYELKKKSLIIKNIAVGPLYRRSGVGAQILDKLIRKLSIQRRVEIIVDVPEVYLSCQLFLRACGFRAVKVVKEVDREDVIVGGDAYRMVYSIANTAAAAVEGSVSCDNSRDP